MSLLSTIRNSLKQDWPSIMVILVAASLQLILISNPSRFLVGNILPDDAFYYFEIARNIAAGAGSTFDGATPTNGYHPLWMVLVSTIFSIFPVEYVGDIAPIKIALYVSVALNIIGALAILKILGRVTDRKFIRAFALGLWSLNPFVIYETVNGLETSVAYMFFALFALAVVRAYEVDTVFRRFSASVTAGFMILSRLDLAIFFAVYLLVELYRKGLRVGLQRTIPMGLIGTSVCLPWFIWNYQNFEMLLTSASNGASYINHTLVVIDNGEGVLVKIKAAVYMLVYHAQIVIERLGAAWVYFFTAGAATTLWIKKAGTEKINSSLVYMAFIFVVGFLILFLINAGIRFTGRAWYFISLNIILVPFVAAIYHFLIIEKKQYSLLISIALLVIGTFGVSWHYKLKNQYDNQFAMYDMAMWSNENLNSDARIGVFNAGVQGYFSKNAVVNLDGLVNNDAHNAIVEGTLWGYIVKSDLAYISDFPIYITYRHAPFFGEDQVMNHLQQIHSVNYSDSLSSDESLVMFRIIEP